VKEREVNGKVLPSAPTSVIHAQRVIDLEAQYAFENGDGAVVYGREQRHTLRRPVELLTEAQARRAGAPKADLFPHRAKIRDRPREIIDG